MHLIEKADHDIDRLVVETEISRELCQQVRASHVDPFECPSIRIAGGFQQAARHPAFDMDGGEATVLAQQVVEARHVNCSMSLRGS